MDETRIKRIIFRAWRRGFREADLIFGPFAERYAARLSQEDLDVFEALLDQPDQDVYAWLTDREQPPEQFRTSLLERIKTFRDSLPIASGDLSGS